MIAFLPLITYIAPSDSRSAGFPRGSFMVNSSYCACMPKLCRVVNNMILTSSSQSQTQAMAIAYIVL